MKNMCLVLSLIMLLFSCSKNESTINSTKTSLFWDCESIEAIEPFKFDHYDDAGKPITFEPSCIRYDTVRDRLVVLDVNKFKLLVISLEGEILQEIGREGEAVSEFCNPGCFDIDRDGNIYIIDNTKVEIYDTLGIEWHSFVPKYRPWQIMVEDKNAIYILTVAQTESKKVLGKYDINGNLLEEYVDKIEIDHPNLGWKKALDALANQTKMCSDSEGNIYVAFANDYRIMKIDTSGYVDENYITKEIPFEIIRPHIPDNTDERPMSRVIADITTDEHDNLYVLWGDVVVESNCRVDIYDRNGNFLYVLRLAIPYEGEQEGMWYISPLNSIIVHNNILYAAENYADGLIYRYDLGNRF